MLVIILEYEYALIGFQCPTAFKRANFCCLLWVNDIDVMEYSLLRVLVCKTNAHAL